MDREKIAKQRRELLESITTEFTRQLIPAVYQNKEECGMEDGILNVYLENTGANIEDVIGQFYFSPIVTDDDTVQYFNAVIFLTEDIDEKRLPALYEAMSYINYYNVTGAFSIDEMHENLIYKASIPMPIEMNDDVLYDQVEAVMGNAITIVDKFTDVLMGILDGSGSIDEFLEILDNTD